MHDYISFFCGIGKVSFLATFFQHASFIAGGLENTSFLFFLRLVGCAYYRKYASAFALQKPTELTKSGWIRDETDGKLQIEWEVEENIQKAQASVDFIMTGCRYVYNDDSCVECWL